MRDTLKKITGVKAVDDVDFSRQQAVVIIDLAQTSPETVAQQLAVKSYNRYSARVIRE